MHEINGKRFNLRVIETDKIRIIKLYEKGIRVPENYGNTGTRGNAKDKEKSLISSIRRAKKSIFGYTIANDWEFWGTLTFDNEKIDRYNLDLISKKIQKYFNNIKSRKYSNFNYLMVVEQHNSPNSLVQCSNCTYHYKNKEYKCPICNETERDYAYHFHLLLNGLPNHELRDTGRTYKDTGRKMFNWIDFEKKFGHNSFIDISETDITERYKISTYLTKYITKSFVEVRQNKKKYWCSKGLAKPTTTNALIDTRKFEDCLFNYYITNNSIHKSEYIINDNTTGEIYNKVYQIIEEK